VIGGSIAMPVKPNLLELNDGTSIPILFENRSVLAIDKPAGWMLVPFNWQKTSRNLHAAIVSAIASGKFWARSRNLKFLCHVHRLDAETTGILLLAKSRGALDSLSDLFEKRRVRKRYLAIVHGTPRRKEWTCRLRISQDATQIGRVETDASDGKEAETKFSVLALKDGKALLDAQPLTGRTHQIRVHLASDELHIVGDPLYGRTDPRPAASGSKTPFPMGLRAIDLGYRDPFSKGSVMIHAPFTDFVRQYQFDPADVPPFQPTARQ